MRNYIQNGDAINVTAPYAVTSGQGVLVGALFGIATHDAANAADVVIQTEGVVDVPATTANTATQGAKIYWDNATRLATTTAGTNVCIGVATAAKANGETVARVRLVLGFDKA